MQINFTMLSQQIAEYPSYFQLMVNDAVILEDTVDNRAYFAECDAMLNSWNSIELRLIDCYEQTDSDNKLHTNAFSVPKFSIDLIDAWPVSMGMGKFIPAVKYNFAYLIWQQMVNNQLVYRPHLSDYLPGTGAVILQVYVNDQGQVIDHYYPGREHVIDHHDTNLSLIEQRYFTKQIFNVSGLRMRPDIDCSTSKNSSTYCRHWGGSLVEITDPLCQDLAAHWMSSVPWPCQWIHAEYRGQYLPIELCQNLLSH